RDDLLPTAYTEALTRLQDATDLVPFAAIAATVREELGIPVTEAYSQFDESPLATASIGASAASWTTARRPPTPTASPGTSPTTPSCGSPGCSTSGPRRRCSPLAAFFERLTTLLRRHRLQRPAEVSPLLRMLVRRSARGR